MAYQYFTAAEGPDKVQGVNGYPKSNWVWTVIAVLFVVLIIHEYQRAKNGGGPREEPVIEFKWPGQVPPGGDNPLAPGFGPGIKQPRSGVRHGVFDPWPE